MLTHVRTSECGRFECSLVLIQKAVDTHPDSTTEGWRYTWCLVFIKKAVDICVCSLMLGLQNVVDMLSCIDR